MQYYSYTYSEPYVTIVCSADTTMRVEKLQSMYNLCPLTIDEPFCDPLKCENNEPTDRGTYYCLSIYQFLGKVEGDTMHLRKMYRPLEMVDGVARNSKDSIFIGRDIYLIRRK